MKTIKIAFNERTNGVAADVEITESGDNIDQDKLLLETSSLAERAQALAIGMSSSKQMRGLR